MKRMQNVRADSINRHIARVRVDPCREDHGFYTGNAHHCPALALQRVIKARGYRVDREGHTLFVRTTLRQYRRLFYRLQRDAEAKYERWVTARHTDMSENHLRFPHLACARCQEEREAERHARISASRLHA